MRQNRLLLLLVLLAAVATGAWAQAQTYKVTLQEGTEDADKWTISPNPAAEGATVTVTYSGSKKILGVKAEKKIVYPTAANATASDIGKVVCAAGHLHDAKAPVPDGCTAVGILGHATGDGHGLILALKNAANQSWNTINGWSSVTEYGFTLKQLPAGALGSLTSYTTLGEIPVSNWCVAYFGPYSVIFQNLGSEQEWDGYLYDNNVNAYITGAGGTAMSGAYITLDSVEDEDYAKAFDGSSFGDTGKSHVKNVRPIIAF